MISFSILLRHNLNHESPFWIVTFFDGFKQITLRTFPIFSNNFFAFFIRPIFYSLHSFEMELHPIPLIIGANEAVGMTAIAINKSIALWQSAITKQNCYLVQTFR